MSAPVAFGVAFKERAAARRAEVVPGTRPLDAVFGQVGINPCTADGVGDIMHSVGPGAPAVVVSMVAVAPGARGLVGGLVHRFKVSVAAYVVTNRMAGGSFPRRPAATLHRIDRLGHRRA